MVRDRDVSLGAQLLDHTNGRGGVGARPIARSAQIVDEHSGAFGREEASVSVADAAAGSGNDDDLSFEKSHGATFGLVAAEEGIV